MIAITRSCSVCQTGFEVHFRYQIEERVERKPGVPPRTSHVFFCSQRCLEASHHERGSGEVICDACASSFRVELARHVLFTGGRRHYACSPECRTRIREGMRLMRLGELADPEQLAPEPDATPTAAADEGHDTVPVAPLDEHDAIPAVLDPARITLPPSARVPALPELTAPPSSTLPRASWSDAPRVVAVFNHKGGTGKTTTAVTLAAGLAARGRRVLLVDADGQGNVAASLGLTVNRSLYHVLVMGLDFVDARVAVRPGLDVLPANETLAAAELYLAGRRHRDRVMATRLSRARELYDHVIIDCSPSLSLLNQNALVMADALLCPVACDYLSLVGVRQVLRTIKSVNKHLSHPVQLWGVLPTQFDGRAKICQEALSTLRDHFGDRCFEPIRLAIKVKEAPAQHKTLLEYAPWSGAASDYNKLIERLLDAGGTFAGFDHALSMYAESGGMG
jgi:chromosome partitioning protein